MAGTKALKMKFCTPTKYRKIAVTRYVSTEIRITLKLLVSQALSASTF